MICSAKSLLHSCWMTPTENRILFCLNWGIDGSTEVLFRAGVHETRSTPAMVRGLGPQCWFWPIKRFRRHMCTNVGHTCKRHHPTLRHEPPTPNPQLPQPPLCSFFRRRSACPETQELLPSSWKKLRVLCFICFLFFSKKALVS